MTKDEALKLALDALEDIFGKNKVDVTVINVIKEALAQPEQEPVAWATEEDYYRALEHELKHIREEMKIKSVTMRCKDYDVALPIIYNDFGRVLVGQPCIPPQRTWVGLTEEDKVLIKHDANFNQFMTAGEYADRVQQLTEARLKDKNT